MEEQKPELQDAIERLTTQVEAQNKLLREFIESHTHFGKRLVAGLWTGLGTVLGATVVVSLLIVVLKPLAEVDWVGPIVNRVIDSLDRRRPAIEPLPVQKQELKQVPVQNP